MSPPQFSKNIEKTGACHKEASRVQPARGPHYDDIAVLPSRTVRALHFRRWRAPCTVWQCNAYVLYLNKLTFKRLAKLQEPIVSFNLTSQPKMSLEHNKCQLKMSLEHFKDSSIILLHCKP